MFDWVVVIGQHVREPGEELAEADAALAVAAAAEFGAPVEVESVVLLSRPEPCRLRLFRSALR